MSPHVDPVLPARWSVFVPVTEPVCTVDGAGVVHAAEHAFRLIVRDERRTLPTVCGRARTRPLAVRAVREGGSYLGRRILTWPPRVSELKDLDGLTSRCTDCYQKTGRPRPASVWGELLEVKVGLDEPVEGYA